MKVKRIVANITTPNPGAAKGFYQDVLGLELLMDLGWIATYGRTKSVQVSFARQLLEEPQYVAALQLTADDHMPCRVDAVNLKHRLRNVETDCRNRLHAWLPQLVVTPSATPSVALRAGEGAVHSIKSRRPAYEFNNGLTSEPQKLDAQQTWALS
jgi:hypothetical protein